MPNESEFDSEFWDDNFTIDVSVVPGPLKVAKMTQSNAYEKHDPRRFYQNAHEIADEFVAMMARLK